MIAALAALIPAFQTSGLLKPQLMAGKIYQYRVVVTQTEYAGTGTKVSSQTKTEMPIQIRVVDTKNLEVTSGPLFTRGRSVGRARVGNYVIDGPRLPSWFYVPIPATGVKPGQKWQGPLSAPAPVPAGLRPTYQYRSNAKGFAQIDLALKQTTTTSTLNAAGSLFLDSKSAIPDHGKVVFNVSYTRPDMKDRTKTVVNSHMTVECVLRPK